ncbi:branched-chain amino acid transport system II carrier protein [Bergeriella denitrificans]|uniref:Branched-chain amino acid transport system carrier protein n=1 Tax=Bergeriella denitrificans TaxID=494 RepID=A0A378UG92_BERDE|nr:branched-chain amino acid transport system II carrier protein [Bergeriella denitrificans]STZ75462.1 LIV-II [Bergeriella denitrificans]
MKQKAFTTRQFFTLSFFLFAMFLGAGNIIFAPVLGQAAGSNLPEAMSGFLITGVGLVLLAIVALARSGGAVENLANRVHPVFSVFYCVALFLVLGPAYVIPRTGAVVYEVAVLPFSGAAAEGAFDWVLLVFSSIFFALTVYLTADIGKMVRRVGDIMTPCFIGLLLVILAVSLFKPLGSVGMPSGDYIANAFGKGFTQGYFTMDVLAAFVFGKIFLDATRRTGIGSSELNSVFVRCGIFSMLALAGVQLSLSWLGATSVSALGVSANGGQALTGIVGLLLGSAGVWILAAVVFLTGLTTAIGCLSAVAEYFSRRFTALSYKGWVAAFGIISFFITNFGLTSILKFSAPFLYLLYPISITLIALALLNRFIGYRPVYAGAVAGAALMGFSDGLKEAGWLPQGWDTAMAQLLPFYSNGMGWIVVALFGGLIGYAAEKIFCLSGKVFENEPIV